MRTVIMTIGIVGEVYDSVREERWEEGTFMTQMMQRAVDDDVIVWVADRCMF